MLEKLLDYIDVVWNYVKHGNHEQVIVAYAEEDIELARSIQMSLLESDLNCRLVTAETVTAGEEVITVKQGKMVFTHVYSGHMFCKPHMVTATAEFTPISTKMESTVCIN